MFIGDQNPLSAGDSIDIYDWSNSFVKRLTASGWSSDQGRVLWDGIKFNGDTCGVGSYLWRRNGGSADTLALSGDSLSATIVNLVVTTSTWAPNPDVSMDVAFTDGDTRSGRIRACAYPNFAGATSVRILDDKFFVDTAESAEPISTAFKLEQDGLWWISLSVWDIGGNEADSQTSWLSQGSNSDAGEPEFRVPETELSRSKPNPSGGPVFWDLKLGSAREVSLNVFGIDGKRVKSWPWRSLPSGLTRLVWDGRNDLGARVAPGKYYLVIKDSTGIRRDASAIIVR
jgi:hypothetical protein